ncbi:hypothetical protein CMI37_31690 [Candidatus Pacearchaeota archaeon]|nr:hypothetical protein [Candidatus Pacearchaeota archaeon]
MSIQLYTYEDAVDHLRTVFDCDTTGREDKQVKHAIQRAYRDIPFRHRWNYYERRHSLRTEASQDTGSIAYTHSTRTVTLTGATFPTNAKYYRIYLASDQAHYPIESYTDSTNIVLPASENPGANVASGTSYIIYRASYPFPCNFRTMDDAWDVIGDYPIRYADNNEVLGHSTLHHIPSTPVMFTINADGNYYGALNMTFSPPPSTARTYQFSYKAAPRPLSTYSYGTGTVTFTAASTTVTGSSTVWTTEDHDGGVIRFSTSATAPTNREGSNPYSVYRIVDAVGSNTSITLDAVPGIAGTAVAYTISDPLDLTSDSMLNYFLRLCESEFAVLTNQKDVGQRAALAHNALKHACAAEARYRGSANAGVAAPFHTRGWSTIPDETVNPSV